MTSTEVWDSVEACAWALAMVSWGSSVYRQVRERSRLLALERERWSRLIAADGGTPPASGAKLVLANPVLTLLLCAMRGELSADARPESEQGDFAAYICRNISGYIVVDVCARCPPTDDDIRTVAGIVLGAELPAKARSGRTWLCRTWLGRMRPGRTPAGVPAGMTEQAVVRFLSRSVSDPDGSGGDDADTPLPVALWVTGRLLLVFRREGEDWMDYLNGILDAMIDVPKVPYILSSLLLRRSVNDRASAVSAGEFGAVGVGARVQEPGR